MTETTVRRIDVRELATRDRHHAIFTAFRRLAASEVLEITNDHDPWPLHVQMQAARPGGFAWAELESGPDVWRVRVVKHALAGDAGGSCCGGGCGGGE